jgi:hypothetical protein
MRLKYPFQLDYENKDILYSYYMYALYILYIFIVIPFHVVIANLFYYVLFIVKIFFRISVR